MITPWQPAVRVSSGNRRPQPQRGLKMPNLGMATACNCQQHWDGSTPTVREEIVDGPSGTFLAGGHQVGVDPQCEARIRVPEIRGKSFDALPRVEQRRGVEVTKRVHPGRPGRNDAGRFDRRTPTLAVEGRPLDRTPPSGGEDQRHRHPLAAERVFPRQGDRERGVLLGVFLE